MSQRPLVVGLLLCEQLVIEENTHNVTHRFTAFAALTDGLGEVTIDVAIKHLEDYEEIYRQAVRLRFTDPLQEVRFIFRVTQCSFPAAGAYEIGLSADGELLVAHKFYVW
jgi:hypothetical protein